jgi:hypothetical protein
VKSAARSGFGRSIVACIADARTVSKRMSRQAVGASQLLFVTVTAATIVWCAAANFVFSTG